MRAMRERVSSMVAAAAAAALLFVMVAAVWGWLIGGMLSALLLAAYGIKTYINRPSA